MKFALIDDNKNELETLTKYITTLLGNNCSIFCFCSGEDFMRTLGHRKYDVIILDMYINQLLGIDIAKKIREHDPNVPLAFCTVSNDFASESYAVNACNYLRKPITEEKVKIMLDKFQLNKIELSRTLTLPDGQNVILRNVTYADYSKRILTIHSKKGDNISTRILFSDAISLFSEFSYFCVCSKGVIVNLYEVASLKDGIFIMKNGEKAPISRRKAKEVINTYTLFRFSQLRQDGDE